MRLLMVTQDFLPNTGGIETYCFELAARFSKKTDYFSVLAPSHADAETFDEKLSYPVLRIPAKSTHLPFMALLPHMFLVYRKKIDTVLHAQWQTVTASILSKKVTGYPRRIFVAAHARELLISPFTGKEGWWSEILYRGRKRIFSHVDGFFPVSRYTASLLKKDGVSSEKINVIGNGTDPKRFKPIISAALEEDMKLNDRKVLLTICRLVPRKGIGLVLSSLREIIKERDDIIYLIGGTGPDEPRLRSLVSDWKLEPYVKFLGRVPDKKMPEYYSLSDVFVMPAKNKPPDVEGYGIVFLEANACGVPVIGSKTGGIPDAVIEGETGYLIEEGDVSQLTVYLKRLIENEKLARKMGQKGRRRVLNEANWECVSDAILEKMYN